MASTDLSAELCVRYRMPLFHSSFPIILFWSEKSGCTSLLKWFFFHLDLLKEARQFHPWIHEYESRVFKDSSYKERLSQELSAGKHAVKLVRNPYSRAVSSFLTLADDIAGKPTHWAFEEWRNIRSFTYGDPNSTEGVTFKQFLLYLAENQAQPGTCNPHLAQQFVPGEEKFCKEHIRLENLRAELRRLERQFSLPPAPLARLFSSPHHHNTSATIAWAPENMINVGVFDGLNAPQYRDFYGDEEIELVGSVFQPDFDHYGYDRSKLNLD